MTFPTNAYILALLGACAIALLSMPLWRKWCVKVGLVDEPGHRKIHDQSIVLAGGLAVMTGILVPTLLAWGLLSWNGLGVGIQRMIQGQVEAESIDSLAVYLLQYGLSRRALQLAGILTGAVGILIVGLMDDRFELRPSWKFAGQCAVALLVAACGIRITLFVPNAIFSYVVTVLWILTVINAFNFMDNMNGLCAGVGAIAAWNFGTLAASQGQYLVALISFLTVGALAGFLPYNFPKARAFLGDAGSHLVGYLLAVLAILPHFYSPRHPRHWAVMIPLIVLAVPLLDLLWVVAWRTCHGLPFYHGDTNHLSHRLVRAGLSRTQGVLVLWCAATLIGLLSWLV